ncbi:hypothetical protein [Streptomyces tubercidicus]|uniref:hypothetical protein n=1 Tax=Streptomyces tubercidicus TaxID=47759 RepID=UPI00346501C3
MQIDFEIPPFFREITPATEEQDARAAVADRAAGHLSELSAEHFEELVSGYQLASSLIETGGVVYAATCLGTVHGELSAGTLTVAVHPLVYTDPGLAAAGIARITSERGGDDIAAEVLDLPCGPVAVTVRQTLAMTIPAEFAESGHDTPIEAAQLQAYIAAPEDQELITVTFTTTSTRHWEEYCVIVAEFLRSIRLVSAEAGPAPSAPDTPTTVAASAQAAGAASPFG